MSNVKMTVQQIKDLGLWDKVCDYKGINPWSTNEGLINYDDIIEFDTEFKEVDKKNIKDFLKDRSDYVAEIRNNANKLYYEIYNEDKPNNGEKLANIITEINNDTLELLAQMKNAELIK
ncbi:hypothetical protein ACSW9O_15290 (plasmid) [Clostridium perfringens]